MAWIESHQTLAAHPKTRKLAMLLGVSKPAAIGHLHCFWWWALDYASDGDLNPYDYLDIAIGAEWEGDAEAFFDAMVAVGFIDITGDGDRLIHDWYDYAGKLIERRKANAERMRKAREEQAQSTKSERAPHVQRTQRARVELPYRTVPNQTKPDRTKPTSSAKPTDERFETWYSAYPKKVGKQKAKAAFQKINWREVDFDHMLAALEEHKQSEDWTKDNGKYIPHPTTYLNRGGWDDELTPLKPSVTEPKTYSPDPDEADRQLRRQLEEMRQQSQGGGESNVIPWRKEA